MNLNPPFDRITIKMGGQPELGGMPVARVLEIWARYPRREELFRDYPFLEEEDLKQALAFNAVWDRVRNPMRVFRDYP
ncbi:MAG: DUF433 domain-containing protein [Candidatus Solibacter sp.]